MIGGDSERGGREALVRPTWDERIARAEDLARQYSFASQVLTFFAEIARLQKTVYEEISGAASGGKPSAGETSSATAEAKSNEGSQPGSSAVAPRFSAAMKDTAVSLDAALRQNLHTALLLPHFPALLELVRRIGPPELVEAAGEVLEKGVARWRELLEGYWGGGASHYTTHYADQNAHQDIDQAAPDDASDAPEVFFARTLIQPFAEHLADFAIVPPGYTEPFCPVCGGEPLVGVLRPEGHGGRRSLVCAMCSTEWDYRRIICPACGESRVEALAIYTAAEFDHVRVEACDTCRLYIKTVDLTKNGLAVPVVDELATIPLNLWAQEQGYKKLKANLLGL
jgi:formate dehydrogenase maturation protein FdhE